MWCSSIIMTIIVGACQPRVARSVGHTFCRQRTPTRALHTEDACKTHWNANAIPEKELANTGKTDGQCLCVCDHANFDYHKPETSRNDFLACEHQTSNLLLTRSAHNSTKEQCYSPAPLNHTGVGFEPWMWAKCLRIKNILDVLENALGTRR